MIEQKACKEVSYQHSQTICHIVASLEQLLNLKTIGFEDLVGLLKAYEERIKSEDKVTETQSKLLYFKAESSNRNTKSSRGRGRGSNNQGRGRSGGRGQGNTQNHSHSKSTKTCDDQKQKGKQCEQMDLSNIQCYWCDKYGHFASRCSDRIKNHEANLNEIYE